MNIAGLFTGGRLASRSRCVNQRQHRATDPVRGTARKISRQLDDPRHLWEKSAQIRAGIKRGEGTALFGLQCLFN